MAASYNGLAFDTSLLAQWAAFFDLAGWRWSRDIAPVENWKPDYRVTFNCRHSECGGSHTIFVSVLPVSDIDTVRGHPAFKHCYRVEGANGERLADAGAVFGKDHRATRWEMSHGAGGGIETVFNWTDDPEKTWRAAGALIHVHRNET